MTILPRDGPVLSAHARHERAADEIHAGEVHIDHAAERGRLLLPERRHRPENAGIVDQDIDAAECAIDRVGRGADGFLVGDIHGIGTMRGTERRSARFGRRAIDVPERDPRPFGREPLCDG